MLDGWLRHDDAAGCTTDCENNDDSGRGVQVLKNRSRTFGRGTLVLCAQMEHGRSRTEEWRNGTLLTELSAAAAERSGFDRYSIDIGTDEKKLLNLLDFLRFLRLCL